MNTCLRSKRPEVRILSGVPLLPKQNQSLASIQAHATASPHIGFDPIACVVSVQLRSSNTKTQRHASAVSGHLTAGRCTLVLADPGTGASGGPESPQTDEKGSALNAGPNRKRAPGVQTLDQQADPATLRRAS